MAAHVLDGVAHFHVIRYGLMSETVAKINVKISGILAKILVLELIPNCVEMIALKITLNVMTVAHVILNAETDAPAIMN